MALLPRLPFVIAAMHLGYGLGTLRGWYDVLAPRPGPRALSGPDAMSGPRRSRPTKRPPPLPPATHGAMRAPMRSATAC